MLDAEEFDSWFRLLETPGIGREAVRRLLAAFGSPEAVLAAPKSALRGLVGAELADAIGGEIEGLDTRLSAAHDWQRGGERRGMLAIGEAEYPPLLLQSADPPLLLYVQGQVRLLSQP